MLGRYGSDPIARLAAHYMIGWGPARQMRSTCCGSMTICVLAEQTIPANEET